MPTEISASRYNALQSRVSAILGTGSGTSGYGQVVTSFPVVGKVGGQITQSTELVSAQDILDLYIDMVKIRRHQSGLLSTIDIDTVVPKIDLVAETTAPTNFKGFSHFENFMTILESNKFNLDLATESSIVQGGTSTRTTNWNSTVTHGFVVRFPTANARRWFFNSGGEVIITPSADISQVATPNSKTTTWAGMVNGAGTIKFNHTLTTTTATLPNSSITTTNIGNYDLTGSYQTIFVKTVTGTYANIDLTVQARENNSTDIEFRVLLNDDSDIGEYDVDEFVSGIFSNTVTFLRATGTNVEVEPPQYLLSADFETGGVVIPPPVVPTPTYTLSTTSSSVNEGQSFTITLITSNVNDGTTLPFTITGITSSDISGAVLSNFFTIQNNIATKTYLVSADATTEGAETFRLALDNGGAAITVTFNDTSTTPASSGGGSTPTPTEEPVYPVANPATSSSNIFYSATSITITTRTFTITNNNSFSHNVQIQNIQKPTGSGTSIEGQIDGSVFSFTLAGNSSRTVSVSISSPQGLFSGSSSYTYQFAILTNYDSQISGTYNTFSIVQNRNYRTLSLSPTEVQTGVATNIVLSGGAPNTSFTVSGRNVQTGEVVGSGIGSFDSSGQYLFSGAVFNTPDTFEYTIVPGDDSFTRTLQIQAVTPTPVYDPVVTIEPSTVELYEVFRVRIRNGKPNSSFSATMTGSLTNGSTWGPNNVGSGLLDTSGNWLSNPGIHTGTGTFETTVYFEDNIIRQANTLIVVEPAVTYQVSASYPSSVQTNEVFSLTISGAAPNDTIYWSGYNSGSGQVDANGSFTFTGLSFPSAGTYGWTITTNSSGSTSVSISVTAPPPPPPTYQISAFAQPDNVEAGKTFSVYIQGGAPNDSCTFSGAGSGAFTLDSSGNFIFANIQAPTTSGTLTWNISSANSGSTSVSVTIRPAGTAAP